MTTLSNENEKKPASATLRPRKLKKLYKKVLPWSAKFLLPQV